jgi:hypothetical protein
MTTIQGANSRHVESDRLAQDDPTALSHYLSPQCFPATRDELQATLVRCHAPTRLLWELTCLSAFRRYDSFDQVCDALARPARPSLPREPI